MVPADAARQVTELLQIPTISRRRRPHTDGQLLVWTDWAGLTIGRVPKFVKQYAEPRRRPQRGGERLARGRRVGQTEEHS